MFKKVSFIFLISAIVVSIGACFPCNCRDKKALGEFFKVINTSSRLATLIINNQGFHSFDISDKDTIADNELCVYFELFGDLAKTNQEKSCLHFVNTAMACKCSPSTFKAKDPIKRIEIYTLNNFDNGHLSGADVTDYFVILENTYEPNGFIKKAISSELLSPLNLMSGAARPSGNTGIMLYLNQKVTLNRNASFLIKAFYESGLHSETETRPIYLKQL